MNERVSECSAQNIQISVHEYNEYVCVCVRVIAPFIFKIRLSVAVFSFYVLIYARLSFLLTF